MKRYRIAILGASGAVGRELLKVLEARSLPRSNCSPADEAPERRCSSRDSR